MKIAASIGASVLLHWLLGWPWTILAGVLCGFLVVRRYGLWSSLSVAAGWAIFVIFDYVAAPEATANMLDVTGQILGNLPGFMVVVLTIAIGALLGLLGGLVGRPLARIVGYTPALVN